MTGRIGIAVVIPTHDRRSSVVGAVRSAATQTDPADEIVVVDDGSSPPVDRAAVEGAAGEVPLTLLRYDRAQGANAARNAGIAATTADWVSFLDDDDRFAPEKLALLRAAIRRDPPCDVVHHAARIHMIRQGVAYTTAPKDLEAVPDPYHDLLIGNWVGGTSMVTVRRSRLAEVGGFDEALPSMQDYDLWLRLARGGARFRLVPDALTHYRYDTAGDAISLDVDKHLAAEAALRDKHAAGYATLTDAEQRTHRVWSLNVATHRALLAGDAATARRLQRRALRAGRSPAALANAVVTGLGPTVAFRVRSLMSRGPTTARQDTP